MLALSLTACVDQRATGPGEAPEPTTLAAMDIKHSPLAAISDTLWGVPVADSDFKTEYMIELTDSAAERFGGRIDDVIIRYQYETCSLEVRIFDHTQRDWLTLERFPGWYNMWGCVPPGREGRWTLSQFVPQPQQRFFDELRILRLAGNGYATPMARLVRYRLDYEPIVLSDSYFSVVRGITATDEGVALSLIKIHLTDGETSSEPSIQWYDPVGNLLMSVPGYFQSMVWAEGRLWVIDHHRTVVGTVDSTGAFQEQFTLPEVKIYPGFNRFCMEMTYGMDRLWFLLEGDSNLHGALLGPSVDSGFAVVDWKFPLRTAAAGAQGIAWDGTYFNVLADYPDWRVHKVNLSSELVASYQLHVRPHGPIASDGEALWIPHTGSPEMGEHVTYLSRFRLP
ncbi:MAG TPA: hypothetical protein VM118_13005 [Acidobacteriota bacterium]|nr:hypothetical protein [Acidobacteriota bacterium]